jgi:hypothetical protein
MEEIFSNIFRGVSLEEVKRKSRGILEAYWRNL